MRIYLHRKFLKKFVRLRPKLKDKFKERRNLFIQDSAHPILNNHPLVGKRSGQWSINVTDDWRAIYIFDEEKQAVIFIDIDTHSNLYK